MQRSLDKCGVIYILLETDNTRRNNGPVFFHPLSSLYDLKLTIQPASHAARRKNVKTDIFMHSSPRKLLSGSDSSPIGKSQACLVGCVNLKNTAANLRSC